MSKILGVWNGEKALLANMLRKIEHPTTEYCQYSEYLTLLNSFPDVKKSDEGASHEH